MHRFYITPDQIQGNMAIITGSDVNHIKNVLRMKQGDEIIICNGQGKDCYCIINKVSEGEITARIKEEKDTQTELKARITLYQGLPKKDKMELIIQKAVELGIYEIVPVMTKRTVIKLEDPRKEAKKLERWQAIAEEAAKQSGRGIIPIIHSVIEFKEAVTLAGRKGQAVIPYENAVDMQHTREVLKNLGQADTISVMIGPEGGFDESEIAMAKANRIQPITLGRRILRTETAGLAILSMMVLMLEE